MRILILGATGMLGYSLFSNLRENEKFEVFGTVRNIVGKERYFNEGLSSIIQEVDIDILANVEGVIESIKPDVVINCIGLIKQHQISKQHVNAIEVNSLFPHKVAEICDKYSAKLIHFSTDCVFSGVKGGYTENCVPDALDIYGKSKCLGEVDYSPHLTLRTSIIGHELGSKVSLVDWFLSQEEVKGFSRAIFSGLPTVYISWLLSEKILLRHDLQGLYHLSVGPINKYKLLNLIASEYSKKTKISKESDFSIDRSLCSNKLIDKLNLNIPSWPKLIEIMHKDYLKRYLL
jgi:dTDP-4-dehydrorhamnose reductase